MGTKSCADKKVFHLSGQHERNKGSTIT